MERNLVLDAGALIGFERGSQMMAVLIEQAEERGDAVVIPASALGQVWRGGPKAAKLAKLAEASEIDALDERRAKEIGARLGDRGGNDIVDAHVVCCAVERKAAVATSDVDDLELLVVPGETVRLMPA
ncbi:MAG TPA: PIN domain-containing protein [Solirubrobacterales bacterium]|nr:PIN domain-containing protein [Solirubrobacterales bacterium]